MTANRYHTQFVQASGASISQREYARAFDVEFAEISDYWRRRAHVKPADRREETAERLAAWYGEAVEGDENHNVARLMRNGMIPIRERAEALFQLVTVHRISYVIMVAAAAVDRAQRGQKGGI